MPLASAVGHRDAYRFLQTELSEFSGVGTGGFSATDVEQSAQTVAELEARVGALRSERDYLLQEAWMLPDDAQSIADTIAQQRMASAARLRESEAAFFGAVEERDMRFGHSAARPRTGTQNLLRSSASMGSSLGGGNGWVATATAGATATARLGRVPAPEVHVCHTGSVFDCRACHHEDPDGGDGHDHARGVDAYCVSTTPWNPAGRTSVEGDDYDDFYDAEEYFGRSSGRAPSSPPDAFSDRPRRRQSAAAPRRPTVPREFRLSDTTGIQRAKERRAAAQKAEADARRAAATAFKAKPIPRTTTEPRYHKMQQRERERADARAEAVALSKAKVEAIRQRRKEAEERLGRLTEGRALYLDDDGPEATKPKKKPFTAKPVPAFVKEDRYQAMEAKKRAEREARHKQRAEELALTSDYPARMKKDMIARKKPAPELPEGCTFSPHISEKAHKLGKAKVRMSAQELREARERELERVKADMEKDDAVRPETRWPNAQTRGRVSPSKPPKGLYGTEKKPRVSIMDRPPPKRGEAARKDEPVDDWGSNSPKTPGLAWGPPPPDRLGSKPSKTDLGGKSLGVSHADARKHFGDLTQRLDRMDEKRLSLVQQQGAENASVRADRAINEILLGAGVAPVPGSPQAESSSSKNSPSRRALELARVNIEDLELSDLSDADGEEDEDDEDDEEYEEEDGEEYEEEDEDGEEDEEEEDDEEYDDDFDDDDDED